MGMTAWQMQRRIVLPQAAVFALPLFANQFLATMKSTSIVFVITVIEVFGAAKLYCEDSLMRRAVSGAFLRDIDYAFGAVLRVFYDLVRYAIISIAILLNDRRGFGGNGGFARARVR